eukprot:CAMPEP_0114360902 /NCGR_PEP_ID=MMETSP0101-20121206/24232_1 /TAXON_ID=38822 ORGANISM="Pteridomonas danica, Strain PT" /NCGR_SAMPLE_ID=MMETSP0101 /ASSEMBLY_ACC=CAM_ASM_000211 /LENGTH=288 /DNA_ID=CAMNT_0001505411 /DNA_START=41 /DNA_END=907 /DNA_ORIENTATION=-
MPRTAYNGIPISNHKPDISIDEQPRKKTKSSSIEAHKENSSQAETLLLENVLALLENNRSQKQKKQKKNTSSDKELKKQLKKSQSQTEFWKLQYESLRNLRETEPERELKEYQISVKRKEESINEIIEELQKNIDRENNKKDIDNSCSLDDENLKEETLNECYETIEELETKLEQKRSIIRSYERLTGFILKETKHEKYDDDDEDDEDVTLQCTAINHIHKRVMKFSLTLPQEQNEPLNEDHKDLAVFNGQANLQYLPSNLRKEAHVETSQLPILVNKILKSFYAPSP